MTRRLEKKTRPTGIGLSTVRLFDPDGVYELRRHTRDDDDDDDVASAGATGGDGGGESRGARARCVRADRASDRARDANVRERGGGQ